MEHSVGAGKRVFDGQVALVTGATSGIGRATAIAFGREGAIVAVLGRNTDAGTEVVRRIEADGGHATFRRTDIAKERAVADAVAGIVADHGRLDIAVNCAGIDLPASLSGSSEKLYECIFDANVRGLLFCLKHQILAMRPNGRGSIVTVGSIAAHRADPGNALYCASKSAARMLTKAASLEAAAYGIRINEVAPGPIETPMLEGYLRRETERA